MKKFIYLFILTILSINLYAETRSKMTHKAIGEIISLERLEKKGDIIIYDIELFNAVKKNIDLLIINDKGEVVANFYSKNTISQTPYIKIQGTFSNIKHKLYMGLRVAFLQKDFIEPNLPDRFKEQNPVPTESYNRKDNTYQILVPAGFFIYGTEQIGTPSYTASIQSRQTEIQKLQGKKRINYMEIDSFYLDQYEITRSQFSFFLKDTQNPPPPNWNWALTDNIPVYTASYEQAVKYCSWAGKRLPTELELEKATRGPNLKSYKDERETPLYFESENVNSIGRELNSETCITNEQNLNEPIDIYLLKDVSYYKSDTGKAIMGLCGNVAEWTSSWFLPYRGNNINRIDYGKRFKVIRGGGFNLNKEWAYSYSRMTGGVPNLAKDFKAGFRCAMDIR